MPKQRHPLSKDELEAFMQDAQKRVKIHCDDYHPHYALRGCIVPDEKAGGDERDVTICKLIEYISWLRERVPEGN